MPLSLTGVTVIDKSSFASTTITTNNESTASVSGLAKENAKPHEILKRSLPAQQQHKFQYFGYYDVNNALKIHQHITEGGHQEQKQQQQRNQYQQGCTTVVDNSLQNQQFRKKSIPTTSGGNFTSDIIQIQTIKSGLMHQLQQQQHQIKTQHTAQRSTQLQQQQQCVHQEQTPLQSAQAQLIQVSEAYLDQTTGGTHSSTRNMMISTTGEVLNQQQIYKIVSADSTTGNVIIDHNTTNTNNSSNKVLLSNLTVLSKQNSPPVHINSPTGSQAINLVNAKGLFTATTMNASSNKQQKFTITPNNGNPTAVYSTSTKITGACKSNVTNINTAPYTIQQLASTSTTPQKFNVGGGRNLQMITRVQAVVQSPQTTTNIAGQLVASPNMPSNTGVGSNQPLILQQQKLLSNSNPPKSTLTTHFSGNVLKKSPGLLKMNTSTGVTTSGGKLINNLVQQQHTQPVKTFLAQTPTIPSSVSSSTSLAYSQQSLPTNITTLSECVGNSSSGKNKSKFVKQYNNAILNSAGTVSIATLTQQQPQQTNTILQQQSPSQQTYSLTAKTPNSVCGYSTKLNKSNSKYGGGSGSQTITNVGSLLPSGTHLQHKIYKSSHINQAQQQLQLQQQYATITGGSHIKFVNAQGTIIQQQQQQQQQPTVISPQKINQKQQHHLHAGPQNQQHFQNMSQSPQTQSQHQNYDNVDGPRGGIHNMQQSNNNNNQSHNLPNPNLQNLLTTTSTSAAISNTTSATHVTSRNNCNNTLLSDDIMIVNGTQMTDELSARILQSMSQKSFSNQRLQQQQSIPKANVTNSNNMLPPIPTQLTHTPQPHTNTKVNTINTQASTREYTLYSATPVATITQAPNHVNSSVAHQQHGTLTATPFNENTTNVQLPVSTNLITPGDKPGVTITTGGNKKVHNALGSRSQFIERKVQHEPSSSSTMRKCLDYYKVNNHNNSVRSTQGSLSTSAMCGEGGAIGGNMLSLESVAVPMVSATSSSSISTTTPANVVESHAQVIHLQATKPTIVQADNDDDDIVSEEVRPVPIITDDIRLKIWHAVLQDHTYANPVPTPLPTNFACIKQNLNVSQNLLTPQGTNSNASGIQQWSLGGIGAVAVTPSVAATTQQQSSYTLYGQQISRNQQDDDAYSAISSGSRAALGDVDPGEETETAPEADAEEDDSITRCICDLTHDDGYMICCDKCCAWQHVDCMGIDRQNIPDEYLCELCQPRVVDKTRARSLQLMKRKEQSQMMLAVHAQTVTAGGINSGASNANGGAGGGGGELGNGSLLPYDIMMMQKRSGCSYKANVNKSTDVASLNMLGTGSTLPGGSFGNTRKGTKILKKAKDALSVVGRKSKKAEKLAAMAAAGISGGKPPRKETKKNAKRKSKTGLDSNSTVGMTAAEKYAANLRQWIENYELAVTNHYSPELRARLHAITKQPPLLQNILNTENPALKEWSSAANSLDRRASTVPHAGGKILISNFDIKPNSPICELRGKYMLTTQYKTQNASVNMNTPPPTNYHLANFKAHKTPGPFIFFYQLPGIEALPGQTPQTTTTTTTLNPDGTYTTTTSLSVQQYSPPMYRKGPEICVDTRTYGNEARFVRRSCRPNAEIQHLFEKGTIHLFIVALMDIRASTEITIRHEPHDLYAVENKKSNAIVIQPTSTACACGLSKDCIFGPPLPTQLASVKSNVGRKTLTLNGGTAHVNLHQTTAKQRKTAQQSINRNRSTSSSGDSNLGGGGGVGGAGATTISLGLNNPCVPGKLNTRSANSISTNVPLIPLGSFSNLSNASSSISSAMHDSGICTSSSSPSVSIPSPTSHMHSPTQQQIRPLILPQQQQQQLLASLPTPMLLSPDLQQSYHHQKQQQQQHHLLHQQKSLAIISAPAPISQASPSITTPQILAQGIQQCQKQQQQQQQQSQQVPLCMNLYQQAPPLLSPHLSQQNGSSSSGAVLTDMVSQEVVASTKLQTLNTTETMESGTPKKIQSLQLSPLDEAVKLQQSVTEVSCVTPAVLSATALSGCPVAAPSTTITVSQTTTTTTTTQRKNHAKNTCSVSCSEDAPGVNDNDNCTNASIPNSSSTPKEKPKLSREDRKMEAILRAIEKMERNQQRKQEQKQARRQNSSNNGINNTTPTSPNKTFETGDTAEGGAATTTTSIAAATKRTVNHASTRKKKRKTSHKSSPVSTHVQRKRRQSRINSQESTEGTAPEGDAVTSESDAPSMHSPPIQTAACLGATTLQQTNAASVVFPNNNESSVISAPEQIPNNVDQAAGLLMAFANPQGCTNVNISPDVQSLQKHKQEYMTTLQEDATSPPATPPTSVSSACLLIEAAVGPLESIEPQGSNLVVNSEFKYPLLAKTKKHLMSNWLNHAEGENINISEDEENLHDDVPKAILPHHHQHRPLTCITSGLESLVQAAMGDFKCTQSSATSSSDNATDEQPQNLSIVAQRVEEFIQQTEASTSPIPHITRHSFEYEQPHLQTQQHRLHLQDVVPLNSNNTPAVDLSINIEHHNNKLNTEYVSKLNAMETTVTAAAANTCSELDLPPSIVANNINMELQLPLQVSTCSNNSSVKKRWLRQAISEETHEDNHIAVASSVSSANTAAMSTAFTDPVNCNNIVNGFTTPLKKRRLLLTTKNNGAETMLTENAENARESQQNPVQQSSACYKSEEFPRDRNDDDVDVSESGIVVAANSDDSEVDVGQYGIHEKNMQKSYLDVDSEANYANVLEEPKKFYDNESSTTCASASASTSTSIIKAEPSVGVIKGGEDVAEFADQDDDVDILRSPSPGQEIIKAEDNLVKIEPEDTSGNEDVKIDVEHEESLTADDETGAILTECQIQDNKSNKEKSKSGCFSVESETKDKQIKTEEDDAKKENVKQEEKENSVEIKEHEDHRDVVKKDTTEQIMKQLRVTVSPLQMELSEEKVEPQSKKMKFNKHDERSFIIEPAEKITALSDGIDEVKREENAIRRKEGHKNDPNTEKKHETESNHNERASTNIFIDKPGENLNDTSVQAEKHNSDAMQSSSIGNFTNEGPSTTPPPPLITLPAPVHHSKSLSDDDIQARLHNFHKENILILQSRNKKSKSSSSALNVVNEFTKNTKSCNNRGDGTEKISELNVENSSSFVFSASTKKTKIYKRERFSGCVKHNNHKYIPTNASEFSETSSPTLLSALKTKLNAAKGNIYDHPSHTKSSLVTVSSSTSKKHSKYRKKSSSNSSNSSSSTSSLNNSSMHLASVISSPPSSSTKTTKRDKDRRHHSRQRMNSSNNSRSNINSSTTASYLLNTPKKRQVNFELELTKDLHLITNANYGIKNKRDSKCLSDDTSGGSIQQMQPKKFRRESSREDQRNTYLIGGNSGPNNNNANDKYKTERQFTIKTGIVTNTNSSATEDAKSVALHQGLHSSSSSSAPTISKDHHLTLPQFNNMVIVASTAASLSLSSSTNNLRTISNADLQQAQQYYVGGNIPSYMNVNSFITTTPPIPSPDHSCSQQSLVTLPLPTNNNSNVTYTSNNSSIMSINTTATPTTNNLPFYNTIYGKLLDNSTSSHTPHHPVGANNCLTAITTTITSAPLSPIATPNNTTANTSNATVCNTSAVNNISGALSEYLDTKLKSYNTLGGYVSHTALFGLSGNTGSAVSSSNSNSSSTINKKDINSPDCLTITTSLSSTVCSEMAAPLSSNTTPLKILTKTASHDPRLNPQLTAPEPPAAPKRKLSINEYRKRMQQTIGLSNTNVSESNNSGLLPMTGTPPVSVKTESKIIKSASTDQPVQSKCTLNSPERITLSIDSQIQKDIMSSNHTMDPLSKSDSSVSTTTTNTLSLGVSLDELAPKSTTPTLLEEDSTRGQFNAAPTLLEKQQENLCARLKSLKEKQSQIGHFDTLSERVSSSTNDGGSTESTSKNDDDLFHGRNYRISSAGDLLDNCLEEISSTSTSMSSSREPSPDRQSITASKNISTTNTNNNTLNSLLQNNPKTMKNSEKETKKMTERNSPLCKQNTF